MSKLLAFAGAAFAALAPMSAAHAATYLFTLTGTDTASFTLSSSPTPDTVVAGDYFAFNAVPGTFDGTAASPEIAFFNKANGGGFEVPDFGFSPEGAVLFTGTVNNPTFKLGTFVFTADFIKGAVNDTLVISNVTAAVPEAATWAMMLAGFGAIGFGMRRQRTSVRFA